MTADIGLAFDEKVRRSLAPLCGPLRIDGFLALMRRERASRRPRGPPRPSGQDGSGDRADALRSAPPGREAPEAEPNEGPPENLADSSKLRAE